MFNRALMLSRTPAMLANLRVKLNSAKGSTKNVSAQTNSGSAVLTFADVNNLAPGMTAVAAGIPAGATILSINSGAKTATLTANTTANVTSGSTITFALPSVIGLSVVADAVAISPTQSLANYHLVASAGMLNEGNLRTYVTALAASLTTATGLAHSLVSAIIHHNKLDVSMLVTA